MDELPTVPRYWHGKEIVVLYAVVAKVSGTIRTFYVASEHHSGVEVAITIAEQGAIQEKWQHLLGAEIVTVVAFRWVSV